MTIAELFVKLAFAVTGQGQLQQVQKDLEKATINSAKAAGAVDAVSYALIGMMDTAIKAAVSMQGFAIRTGLSTDEMQQWTHTAALANVSASEIVKTVEGIQQASAKLRFGQGNPQPWALLGINPHSDPFVILRQLNTELSSLDKNRVAAARMIAEQAGIGDNVFTMLAMKNLPIDSLQQMYLLTTKNQQELKRLDIGWNELTDTAGRLKNRFASELAPAFTELVAILQKGVDMLGHFVDWLDKGSPAAEAVKVILAGMAVAVVVLAAGLTTLTAVIGGLTAATIAFELAGAPMLVTLAAISAAIVGAIALYQKLHQMNEDLTLANRVENGDLQAELVDPRVRHYAQLQKYLGDSSGQPDVRTLSGLLQNPTSAASGVNIGTISVNVGDGFKGDAHDLARAIPKELAPQLASATYTRPAAAR